MSSSQMRMSEQTNKPAGPIAIIAVHGVADQKKDETALNAVNLLLHVDGLDPETGMACSNHSYEGFESEKIQVGIRPLDVSSVSSDQDAWHYQLRDHLLNYKTDNRKEVFETVRIAGDRVTRETPDADPIVDRKVHVFELHWADVSNLQFGIMNLFAAIYRLLFEASWIGRQTIGKWASFGDDVHRFSSITTLRGVLMFLHSVATMILTRFMPVIYIIMIFMLMLTAIPALESKWATDLFTALGGYSGLFTFSVVILVGGALIGFAFAFWRVLPWPPIYLIIAFICFLVGNIAFVLLNGKNGNWWAESGLAIMVWLGVCFLMNMFVFPVLNRAFPGTKIVGNILLLVFFLGLFFGLAHVTDWPLLISGPIHALRFGSSLLPIAWIVLSTAANLFLLLSLFELTILRFRLGLDKEVAMRRRSRLRTGIISITLPILLISFLNATFFQLVLIPAKLGGLDGVKPIAERANNAPEWMRAMEEKLHEYVNPVVARFSSFPDFEAWSEKNAITGALFSDYAKFASNSMVVPFMEIVFLIIVLVLGYSLWIVTPAVLAEKSQTVLPDSQRWSKLSEALGKNLTQGYTWIWYGQFILVLCMFTIQFLFTFRGIRSGEIKANPGKPTTPIMALADQFLGLRRDEASVEEGAPVAMARAVYGPNRSPMVYVDQETQKYKPNAVRDAPKREQFREFFGDIWKSKNPDYTPKKRPQRRPQNPNPDSASPAPGNTTPDPTADILPPAALEPTAAPAPTAAPTDMRGIIISLLTESAIFFSNGPLTSVLGISIVIIGVGYIFFSRLTDPLVAGLRGGLDIALDVVSYLHPYPKNRTTRAQILSRYSSLLRYIVDWRDPQNPEQGYSRIVILTHSQGGLITSDLLRALAAGTVAEDNGLQAISTGTSTNGSGNLPVRLITMGSPQVQLYHARFPDLYYWDRTTDPRTTHRGLESWWNLYRSGDYVGRMIFRDPKDKSNFLPEVDFVMNCNGKQIPIRETCLGPGAHTHYWDKSAPVTVVRKFDRMISCENIEELAQAGKVEEKKKD